MGKGNEVATAVVTIVPSMEGSQETITKELTGSGSAAGTIAGAAVGSSMASSISSSMKSAGKTMTAAVTVPLVAAGVAGVKSFAEVDKTMALTTKTMGATTEEAQLLNKAMKDAAMNSTFGMSDAANASLNFARAGLSAEEAANALAPAMNLAAGEGGNLDTVSGGLVATINGFHGAFSEASHYADVFAASCNNSALDVDSLSNAMSVAAPVFSAAGYSVEDASLFMGVMANNGIEAGVAANSLKTGMARLVAPTESASKMMDQLQFSILDDNNQMKDCVTIQKELHDAFVGLEKDERLAAASAIFGKNQMSAWLALIMASPDEVDALSNSLENCEGTTREMADAMMNGFGGSLEKLKSSLDVAKTSLGEALAPMVSRIADIIQGLTDAFNSLPPGMQQFIATAGVVVAAVGPMLLIGSKLITAVGTIKTAFSGLTGIMSGVASSFGGITGLMGTNISTLASTVQGKLGIAGAAVGTFFAAFKFTDWILEITGAKEALEDFGSAIYDFFHQAQNASVDLTEDAMAAFTAYATQGVGTYDEVMQKLTAAQQAALDANTEITRQDAESLQKFIDLMENGVAEARANEAQARQLANETMIAENQMTAETLQATMDLAQQYIDTGAGNAETIMANLETAYAQYSANMDAESQTTAANIQAMMDNMTAALSVTSETMVLVAGEAAENLQTALADANTYLETGRGDTEAILNNLKTAYDLYATETGDSSVAVSTSVDTMVAAVEAASGVQISATDNMQAETVADLATISQAMSDLGITDVGQFVSAIESGVSSVESSFSTMESNISSSMANASSEVSSAISEIESAFANANLSFQQHIALPHFSMSGSFNAETGEVPSVSVSWYKKAAEEGALFADPTLIGVGDANQPELLIGENTLYEQIAKAVAESNGGGDIVIPVYIGGELLDEIVVKAVQRNNYRSGGR